MERHISTSYDREIDNLGAQIHAMGKLCEWQLAKATKAFKITDKRLADEVIKADQQVNELHRKAENDTITVLARRQPVAGDLRYIISVIKIASEFERIADYAANISKRVLLLEGTPFTLSTEYIIDISRDCRTMINSVLDAFDRQDELAAATVWKKDNDVDKKFVRFMNTLKREAEKHEDIAGAFTGYIFIGRCLERIGDHVTNIAENIYYIKTGDTYLSHFEQHSD
ncbi:phosphate signaling complex protein PhoU [Desulfobacter vibrioformis]|uniref:phosphate signaling complex protein PhoU n=1 Tax=Desulfobacter vibrioformis TaxID=34031 RepID=UPI000553B934|nr:phosphate signaling complex protein PhoU [Desulfobacter vibrioformis]